jgi:hypothetical protein
MKLSLRIVSDDGEPQVVEASARDFVAFEDKYDRSISSFSTQFFFRDICFLAWHAAKRKKLTNQDFEKWLDGIEGVEMVEGGDSIPHSGPSQPTG